MTRYISLDIETTGLDPHQHNILEFGAVLDDLSVQAPLDELPRFHAYVLPPSDVGYTGDPYALQMNAGILRVIANRGRPVYHPADATPQDALFLHPGELADHFADWCRAQGLSKEKPPTKPGFYAAPAPSRKDIRFVPAGKNVAGFDLPFLRACIPGWSDFRISHRALDPGMLYFDPRRDTVPPDLAGCLKRAGKGHMHVDHTAVGDSMLVIEVLRAKYPVETMEKTCMCDGGGSIMHPRSPDCTSGQPVV